MPDDEMPMSPASFAAMMRDSMRTEGTGQFDAGKGYVQWVGFPGGGLHVEASDGRPARRAMNRRTVKKLTSRGWGRPDKQVRNCWFQITEEADIPTAVDLVFAAFEVLLEEE